MGCICCNRRARHGLLIHCLGSAFIPEGLGQDGFQAILVPNALEPWEDVIILASLERAFHSPKVLGAGKR